MPAPYRFLVIERWAETFQTPTWTRHRPVMVSDASGCVWESELCPTCKGTGADATGHRTPTWGCFSCQGVGICDWFAVEFVT